MKKMKISGRLRNLLMALVLVVSFSSFGAFNATHAYAQDDYTVYGPTSSYMNVDKIYSNPWGTEKTGVRVYVLEHGTYNTDMTDYNADILVYKDKKLVAAFTQCSALPDYPKTYPPASKSNPNPNYPAIVNQGEYKLVSTKGDYASTGAPAYMIKTTGNSGTLPCVRWTGKQDSFAASTCTDILVHAGKEKVTNGQAQPSSTGCVNIYGATHMQDFCKVVGTGTFAIYIGYASGGNVALTPSISPTSVTKSGSITCTLATDEATTHVTAMLDTKAQVNMKATDATHRKWTYTYSGFSSTGTHTVTFKAKGANGSVRTATKTFTVTANPAANVILTPSISPNSVTKSEKVTCTLTTNQAVTKVTATLNGNNSPKTMVAADSTHKKWTCTYSNFTATGIRTVKFTATGTNGKAVSASKTFTVATGASLSTSSAPNVIMTPSISPTSVAKSGLVTCTLTTNQAATKVTATLNGNNSAKTMVAADSTHKKWTCTYSNFTSTGTRTVTFSATGTNGKAVTATKTFTVTASTASSTSSTSSAPNVIMTPSISPTSVAKSGLVTCTLTTNQAATSVTATLNGNAAKTMTAADSTHKKWTCTFTNFTSTGTRTVTFSAKGTNGKAVTATKTFTITASTTTSTSSTSSVANVTLTPSITPTSVKKAGGLVTCTLTTNQAATSVTATLNGNAAKTMTAADSTHKKWTCTFTNFTSTGTRTVTFKATGTNGKAVTATKTFTVTS